MATAGSAFSVQQPPRAGGAAAAPATGRLPGTLTRKSSFTTALHTYTQAASVGSFYQQTGGVEFAALLRMNALT